MHLLAECVHIGRGIRAGTLEGTRVGILLDLDGLGRVEGHTLLV